MGFKSVRAIEGYLLKDVIQERVKIATEDLARSIAVISAKDGYRGVFSLSELLNRNDNQDILLVDYKDSQDNGRYTLFATPDYFVDRNVRAIEKIEIVRIN